LWLAIQHRPMSRFFAARAIEWYLVALAVYGAE
jgi:hypothetical protein